MFGGLSLRGPKGRGKRGTPLIRHGLAAVTPSPQGGRQSDVIRPGELTFSRGSRLQSRAACVILCIVRVKSAATQIFAYWETIIAHQSPKVNRLWGFFSVLTKDFCNSSPLTAGRPDPRPPRQPPAYRRRPEVWPPYAKPIEFFLGRPVTDFYRFLCEQKWIRYCAAPASLRLRTAKTLRRRRPFRRFRSAFSAQPFYPFLRKNVFFLLDGDGIGHVIVGGHGHRDCQIRFFREEAVNHAVLIAVL